MQLEIRLNLQVDRQTEQAVAGLARLQNRGELSRMIQDIMRRTLLEGVRKRFAQHQADMALVSVAGTQAEKALNSIKIRTRLQKLSKKIAHAQLKNDQRRLAELQREQAEIVRSLVKGSSALHRSRGKFVQALKTAARQRASQMRSVRDLLTRGPFDVDDTGDALTVNVGAVPVLNSIKAISATTILTGKPSTSLYRHLWLQMEFGMGVYAKPSPLLHNSRFKTATGSWWYGGRRGQGIHFLGQKPGNLLRTKLGLAYSQDSDAFLRLFASQMSILIFGK